MLAEALLSVVTEAVIEHVIRSSSVDEQLRQWLSRDPARLAFRIAFTRAYTAFVRHYPDLTASFFDEHFLTNAAAPELAKLLTRDQYPDPVRLAQLWQAQFASGEPFITRASSDFLHWLESELKREAVFAPIFDTRALENLPALEANIDDLVQFLQTQLMTAEQEAQRYRIEGTIHVHGNVQGSALVVGHDNTVTVNNMTFQGDYARLQDCYCPPDSIFQDVKVDEFVGRSWLTAKVDAFLQDPKRKSGALLLVGEAGVGKTSVLAHLVRERRYLHLFGQQVSGEALLPRAVLSLAAQLVSRYRIEPYANQDALPQQLSSYSDFLDRLLRRAVQTLSAGEQVVIVCDALDEAGAAPGGNVFGLPKILPDGVFLILSQRPVSVQLDFTDPPIILMIEPSSPENIADVEAYLEAVARRPAIAQQLRAHSYSDKEFVRVLTEKSAGIWIYLHYVIGEIERGERTPLNLEQLPTGLAGYYAQYWRRWRSLPGTNEPNPKWRSFYAPLLGVLAVVQEPVSISRLVAWIGGQVTSVDIGYMLRERWGAFVSEYKTSSNAETTYSLYHASLRDFITGHIVGELPPGDTYLIDDLREQVVNAHRWIVDQYRVQCGGKWETLVLVDDYARRYLVTHLDAVEPQTMLELVMRSDAWAKAREANEENYVGYLGDLDLAWRWVQKSDEFDLGAQLRCALIRSSIHGLSSKVPTELVIQAVIAGVWSPARALTFVIETVDEERRADLIHRLAGFLPEALKLEALEVTRELQEPYCRAWALCGLAPYLKNNMRFDVVDEVLNIVQDMDVTSDEDASKHDKVLIALAPLLTQNQLHEQLSTVKTLRKGERRSNLVIGFAPYLEDELLREALEVTDRIGDNNAREDAFLALVRYLPGELMYEALIVAARSDKSHMRARALRAIAPKLTGELAQTALEIAYESLSGYWFVWAVSGLLPYLPEDVKQKAVDDAFQTAQTIDPTRGWHNMALGEIAPHLDASLQREVCDGLLNRARNVETMSERSSTLQHLVPSLPVEMKEQVLQEALKVLYQCVHDEDGACLSQLVQMLPHLSEELWDDTFDLVERLKDGNSRARVLEEAARHVPKRMSQRALDLARTIEDKERRVRALCELAPSLTEETQRAAISEALTLSRHQGDDEEYAMVLMAFAANLSEGAAKVAFDDCSSFEENLQAHVIWKLAPRLPGELMVEALAIIRNMQDKRRGKWLSRLVAYLPEEEQNAVFEEALAIAEKSNDAEIYAAALEGVVSGAAVGQISRQMENVAPVDDLSLRVGVTKSMLARLHNKETPFDLLARLRSEVNRILQQALQASSDQTRVNVLHGLAPYLDEKQWRIGIELMRIVKDEASRARLLRDTIQYVPKVHMPKTLDMAHRIQDLNNRIWVLADVVPHLPSDAAQRVSKEVMELVRGLRGGRQRADKLSLLVGKLSADVRQQVINEALVVAQRLSDDEMLQAQVYCRIVRFERDDLCQTRALEALQYVNRVPAGSQRRSLLSQLLAYLPSDERLSRAEEALELLKQSPEGNWQAEEVAEVLSFLPLEKQFLVWKELLAAALEIKNVHSRSHRFGRLIEIGCSRFNDEQLSEGIGTALWKLSEFPRSDLLRVLPEFKLAFERIGSRANFYEILKAMRDVRIWWP